MLLFFTISAFASLLLICTLPKHKEPAEERFPINYPIEPMFENYSDIIDEIQACKTTHDLNSAYIRIIIFSGCYQDSASFLSDLWCHFEKKENELQIFI